MKSFLATITTDAGTWTYSQIALTSIDVAIAAIDRFGVCKITVRPA